VPVARQGMRTGPVIAGVHRGLEQGGKEPDKRVVSWSWNSSDGGSTPPASTKLAGGVVRVATRMHGTGTSGVQGRAQENMPPTNLGGSDRSGNGCVANCTSRKAVEWGVRRTPGRLRYRTPNRYQVPAGATPPIFLSQCTGLRAGQPPPRQRGGGKSELHRAPYGVTPRHAPGRDD